MVLFYMQRIYCTRKFSYNGVKYYKIVLILLLFSFLDTRIFYVALATFIAGLYPLVWNIRYTHRMIPELKVSVSSFSIRSIKELISSEFGIPLQGLAKSY